MMDIRSLIGLSKKATMASKVQRTHCLLTGSHVYGFPNEDSDVDLVIRCDLETATRITELVSGRRPGDVISVPNSVRVNRLNLIFATSPRQMAYWIEATEKCAAKGPMLRIDCVKIFGKVREKWLGEHGR